ncbi:MAG: bifunctional diaminohydroxyphosphoribosylaminopyrimidine deaminase/5-amino-6-(5-phosphoribosylamino)uracil reductase RibD [Desulforhopalus sp.]|nr:bifunctional diaminohydroxyphosphoribosylaminopyrimidine deaminase/5-amino-6-(5-phosphoribosylamino)uracil reductase RibD [Desulforhopalus sp.]
MEDSEDEKFMALALDEAKKGLGRTSPNPCVGAVIVRDGRLLASGWHKKAGTPHAERNAIANALAAGVDLQGAVIYVTLEPCSHTGRTPPCCDALIKHHFSRVVVGMGDPNPLVNGRGIALLKGAGIEVTCGVLEEECRAINRPFLKYITTGRPWMIMKAGLSLDGRLNYKRGESGWMTGGESLHRVHQIRNCVDAIMVGRGTVAADDPSLTTRLQGEETGKDPVRVILDSHLSLSADRKVFHLESDAPTLVFCGDDVSEEKRRFVTRPGVEVCSVESDSRGLNLGLVLDELGRREICSVLVEGGGALHATLLGRHLYDEAVLFYGLLFAGDGGIPLLEGWSAGTRGGAPHISAPEYEHPGGELMIRGLLDYSRCP